MLGIWSNWIFDTNFQKIFLRTFLDNSLTEKRWWESWIGYLPPSPILLLGIAYRKMSFRSCSDRFVSIKNRKTIRFLPGFVVGFIVSKLSVSWKDHGSFWVHSSVNSKSSNDGQSPFMALLGNGFRLCDRLSWQDDLWKWF